MIKCKCKSCGLEDVFETQKQAWMDGWNFLDGGLFECEKCSEPVVKEKENETTYRKY